MRTLYTVVFFALLITIISVSQTWGEQRKQRPQQGRSIASLRPAESTAIKKMPSGGDTQLLLESATLPSAQSLTLPKRAPQHMYLERNERSTPRMGTLGTYNNADISIRFQ